MEGHKQAFCDDGARGFGCMHAISRAKESGGGKWGRPRFCSSRRLLKSAPQLIDSAHLLLDSAP
eukprot:334443-Rhodomonas_salina.3